MVISLVTLIGSFIDVCGVAVVDCSNVVCSLIGVVDFNVVLSSVAGLKLCVLCGGFCAILS